MARIHNPNSDNVIKQFMLRNPNHPKPFKELSRRLPQYTTKQIHDRWHNYLDPRFDRSDFSLYEKLYIDIWVDNRRGDNKIPWKSCQEAMKEDFDRVYPCRKIKNYYYSNKRRLVHRQPALAHRQPALTQAGTSTQITFARITVASLIN